MLRFELYYVRNGLIEGLLERLDHAILRIDPLHVLDQLRVVDVRLARQDDAGADRPRLRLPVRHDLQGRLLGVSCGQNPDAKSLVRSKRGSLTTFGRKEDKRMDGTEEKAL